MNILRYISYFVALMMAASCSIQDMAVEAPGQGPDDYLMPDPGSTHYISGKVFDNEDNVLEHIRVTIDWNGEIEKSTKYTASDGSFRFRLPAIMNFEGATIPITLDDIDGEANGGRFESLTDNIVFSYNSEATGFLVYRLNRATPSESSPQP